MGWIALQTVGASWGNSAFGAGTLSNVSAGRENTAVGLSAGSFLSSGSFNIYIGSGANPPSFGSESNTMRLGGSTVTKTFVAGVRGVTTGVANGVSVVIDGEGQLGTVSSSRRFKHQVSALGTRSRRILELRPTSFKYLPSIDATQTETYGLIAEEVERVMPELVARDREGNIETVKYQLLPVLLLNELQRMQSELDALREDVRRLRSRTP
jgi:hypothetical protein